MLSMIKKVILGVCVIVGLFYMLVLITAWL